MLYVALVATNAVPPSNFPRPVANPAKERVLKRSRTLDSAKAVPTTEDALNAEHFGRGEAYCQTYEKFKDRQIGTFDQSSFGHRNHEWWAKIELPSQK